MILRLKKGDPRSLLDVTQHFLWQMEMPIQSRADRGPTERELAQNLQGSLGARFSVSNLLRVPGKFLTEAHRCRVHQVSAPDLNNVPEFFCLSVKRFMQSRERRNEVRFQLFRRADVDGGRNHVVARLSHVDVIVGVNERT